MQIARSTRRVFGISLTPLIDVVFILIVFFMLASSFLDWRSVEVKFAAQGTESKNAETSLQITIAENGQLTLDNQRVRQRDLAVALRKKLTDAVTPPLVIRTQQGVPLQKTMEIMERVKAAGITDISLGQTAGGTP